MHKHAVMIGLVALVSAQPAFAAVVSVATVDAFKSAIQSAQAGDEIVLDAGTYSLSTPLTLQVNATAALPVLVHSAPQARAIIQQTENGDETFIIDNSAYVTLSGLELTGGTRLRIENSDYVTIDDCIIHDIAGPGITVNDGTSGHQYVGLVFTENDIHATGLGGVAGQGMAIGCTAATCTVVGAIIADNYIHDSPDAGVANGSGIFIQAGVSAADVRDNIIVGMVGLGLEAFDALGLTANIVERNGVWTVGGAGIVVGEGAHVRNNIVIDATGSGIATDTTTNVKNIDIVNNTVVVSGTALQLSTPQVAVNVINNALFGDTAINVTDASTPPTVANNIGAGAVNGVASGVDTGASVSAEFVSASADASHLNVYPKSGSTLIGAGDALSQPVDDFNGTARDSTHDVGAYVFAVTGNPGAALTAGFKTLAGDSDETGGDSDIGGGDTGSGGPGGSTPAPPGEGIPIPDSSGVHEGCTALASGWAVSLLVTIASLVRRRRPR